MFVFLLFLCPVQPDSPRIVSCQEVEQGLNVSIDPPASWSTPHSFFSLEHEIEYVLKDNGQVQPHMQTPEALVPCLLLCSLHSSFSSSDVCDFQQLQHSQFALIPKKISKLRVRSRDALVMSAWSQWTPWKNVTY